MVTVVCLAALAFAGLVSRGLSHSCLSLSAFAFSCCAISSAAVFLHRPTATDRLLPKIDPEGANRPWRCNSRASHRRVRGGGDGDVGGGIMVVVFVVMVVVVVVAVVMVEGADGTAEDSSKSQFLLSVCRYRYIVRH